VICVLICESLRQNHNVRKTAPGVFGGVRGQVEEIAGKFVRLIRKQYFQLQSDDEHAMSGANIPRRAYKKRNNAVRRHGKRMSEGQHY
jgi:hypothetical protein